MGIDNINIKKANDEIELINAIDEEKRIARFYENGALEARFQYTDGFDDGIIKGRAEGEKIGKLGAFLELAKQMLNKKYSVSEIKELTGLSEKEILKLAESL